jgi:hypothetical protein
MGGGQTGQQMGGGGGQPLPEFFPEPLPLLLLEPFFDPLPEDPLPEPLPHLRFHLPPPPLTSSISFKSRTRISNSFISPSRM